MIQNQYADGTYQEKVHDWHAGDSAWKASKVLQMLEKNQLHFDSIYDVGCGVGEVLVELQKKIRKDVTFVGFDISPQAIEIAKVKENTRLKFYNEDFLKSEIAAPDVLLLLDVFEHVPDYLGFLDAIRGKTNWIIFHIPLDACARSILLRSNYMLFMREQFGHLHYFTKETALATLIDLKYDIVDHFFTTDDEINSTAALKGMAPKITYFLRCGLFGSSPSLAAALLPHFNLMVLARGGLRPTSREL